MSYTVTNDTTRDLVCISEVPNGTLVIAGAGEEFAGELFYKNVAGIIGISNDRYWPSEYMRGTYQPNFKVRIVTGSITITRENR